MLRLPHDQYPPFPNPHLHPMRYRMSGNGDIAHGSSERTHLLIIRHSTCQPIIQQDSSHQSTLEKKPSYPITEYCTITIQSRCMPMILIRATSSMTHRSWSSSTHPLNAAAYCLPSRLTNKENHVGDQGIFAELTPRSISSLQ